MQKYGFNLVEERTLSEIGGLGRLWIHEPTGAQVLSIVNEDDNKCFGANFYTPPVNSTGVAHILEHSVLCGSKKYPVKEPFVELLKGSLQTFLNAFTFPDKTCYPVASANLQDFYNLIDVYLDAVFHPLISKDTFAQEGWHVEAENIEGPWSFRGVVYNEMKGVYSSPDSVLAEKSQHAVFPDNLYSLDSGGNPECIPDLTYEAFCDFHRRYYQPGNCHFFFWGNDPEEKRLRIIANVIEDYGKTGPLPELPLQKSFSTPRYIEAPYAAAGGDERAMFTLNWLLGERGDVELSLKMEMLEHILEGLPGSPLRRALLESGMGEDVTGCGLETSLRQMYYSTGLKGIAPAKVGEAEKLIMDTLKGLVDNGIDTGAVLAAVNSVEFAYRENNTGRFPRGLSAMLQSLSTWLYGGNPFSPLAWEEPLARIKAAVEGGDKIFENAIRMYFLENTNRVRVAILPDSTLGKLRDDEEKTRLDAIFSQASQEKRHELVEETAHLRNIQLSPDTPEDLAKIPALGIADLPRENMRIPREIFEIPQKFVFHDLPTNGIAYVTLLLPFSTLPNELVPYLPMFGRSFLEWGTAEEDYVRLGMKMAANLGSISVAPLVGTKLDSRNPYCYLAVAAKAVYEKLPAMFAIFREILLKPQNSHQIILQRLNQMLPESRARLEQTLQTAGNAAAALRLKSRFTGEGALMEQMGGVSQLWHLRSMESALVTDPDKILSSFENLRTLILGSENVIIDCVSEKSVFDTIHKETLSLLKELPVTPAFKQGIPVANYSPMEDLPKAEVFITPGRVNYVGKAANLYDLGYTYSGTANVILRWLRMGRLWEDVRVAGGAYGVSCVLDRLGGTLVCTSYRDPAVDGTLSAYDGMAAYLRGFSPTPEQLSQAIVGAVGDLDTYLLPDAKGTLSLAMLLSGQTAEMRQKMREEMLSTSASDFHDFADVLAAAAEAGDICVVGGQGASTAAHTHGWKEYKL